MTTEVIIIAAVTSTGILSLSVNNFKRKSGGKKFTLGSKSDNDGENKMFFVAKRNKIRNGN